MAIIFYDNDYNILRHQSLDKKTNSLPIFAVFQTTLLTVDRTTLDRTIFIETTIDQNDI